MKKLLLIYCAYLCSFFAHAQTVSSPNSEIPSHALQDYRSSLQKNVPPSVAAFHETKLVSVNNHRGAANINVPLYQIKQGGVTIPIRLNYLSTGVKVNSIASSVGLNWSLEAGGSVIKDIVGYEDFSNNLEEKTVSKTRTIIPSPTNKTVLFKELGWFTPTPNPTLEEKGILLRDSEPDRFYVNAPGLSTSFTHKKYTPVEGTKPFEINYQGNEIRTTIGNSNVIELRDINDPRGIGSNTTIHCINNIRIRNNQGISYTFDKLDVDQYSRRQIPSPETSSNIPALTKHTYSNEVKVYHLSTITDLNGDDIRFEYEIYKMAINNYDRTQVWDINEGTPELRKSIFTSVFYPQLHRIKKIHFKNGSVEFLYNFNRTDLEEGGKALSEIIVRDKHGTFVKKIRLDYKYFISNNGCSEYYCKRLQLKEVYQVDVLGTKLPPYQFFYDPTALPVVGASTTDYLGYSKGLKASYTQDLNHNISIQAPKLMYNINNSILSFHNTIDTNTRGEIRIKGQKDLTPVSKYAKAASLIKMITPTGAVQDFEYELNSIPGYKTNVLNVPAAGLRIKRQTITDEKGDVVLLENYMYENKSGFSTGVVNYMPPFVQTSTEGSFKPLNHIVYPGSAQIIRIRSYLSSQKENQLSSPGHIGYANVIVKNGLNNGTTEYSYTTPKKNTIENFITCYDDYTRSRVNNPTQERLADKTILHGLLTSVKVRDVYNNILKETSYRYDYQVFNNRFSFVKLNLFKKDPLGEDPIDHNLYLSPRKYWYWPKIDSHRYIQKSIVSHVQSPENYISKNKTEKIIYDPIYPFIKEKMDITNADTLVTKYRYPTDITSTNSLGTPNLSTREFNTIGLLKNKRMLSTPIQIETYLNNNKISTTRVNYKDFGNQIYAPESLTASKGVNNLEVTIRKKHDTNGNLVELRRENGISVVYIYGYNKSYLVAKIENATLSNIPTSYITAIQVASNNDKDRTIDTNTNTHIGTEGALRKELYKLYNLSSLQKAMITVYTHDPLIGMTSITDSRKIITYYDYDSFNRLEFVKDYQGNIIKQNCYNYKGERKQCINNN